jgi:hypothetical protein
MSLPHASRCLDGYLTELSRLRHLPIDQFEDEADRLVPIWVAVKVAPAP